ncbi:hypothetical protein BX616_001817 [Lobosporangium transversale]|uniref:Uncharacterized protein n=1 Tax=Lobosporangium transversale TaxID=64571 RepID=A0A1Y2GNK8_9FUNG|nr:hypothetical protein BCR41DRAFT_353123 [Lobosporangium transversale]KAF9902747.1 hypothetical protein BX616_001817 [Lobosporangium transversale]ORZ16761.1 hypothetical protein BCR41DRAFT_353123 [Lobosporangium transversale]|eukprot:XP_021881696.1 hypothetical protein BCR41DRAFT_353123 [Lobosporangium transversale]
MKLHHPIILFSLSLTAALTFLTGVSSTAYRSTAVAAAHNRQHRQHHSEQFAPIARKRALSTKRSSPSTPIAKSLRKRASEKSTELSSSSSSSIPNTPLLLLPDSHSVWQTGSYQTVRWSRKYIKSLPDDTTVDIVLMDARTNRKIHSLKRFIPFKRGSAQVRVPVSLPEGVSFVLILELYRGRSQEQVTGTITASSASLPPYEGQQQRNETPSLENISAKSASYGRSMSNISGDAFSTVVRRSDISISSRARRKARGVADPKDVAENVNDRAHARDMRSGTAGSHHDINDDDYYIGANAEHGYQFLPEEMREEYPNTVRPLDLEHTFGLHQKVYTLTPYTLEWKIPARVVELMEYTRQAQMLASAGSKINQGQPSSQQQLPSITLKSTFLAKVMVELVLDQTLETISVLARDIPAETMFQYLSIQDRVPPAFYRLRVRMVVVEVKVDDSKIPALGQYRGSDMYMVLPSGRSGSNRLGMEGWEFPNGGKVIDRYEAVTRRFWISQGAL